MREVWLEGDPNFGRDICEKIKSRKDNWQTLELYVSLFQYSFYFIRVVKRIPLRYILYAFEFDQVRRRAVYLLRFIHLKISLMLRILSHFINKENLSV